MTDREQPPPGKVYVEDAIADLRERFDALKADLLGVCDIPGLSEEERERARDHFAAVFTKMDADFEVACGKLRAGHLPHRDH